MERDLIAEANAEAAKHPEFWNVVAVLNALTKNQPLFTQFWPDGREDFRGMTFPCAWRGGVFNRRDDIFQCKALFGQQSDADQAVRYLSSIGIGSNSLPGPGLSGVQNSIAIEFRIPEGFRLPN